MDIPIIIRVLGETQEMARPLVSLSLRLLAEKKILRGTLQQHQTGAKLRESTWYGGGTD